MFVDSSNVYINFTVGYSNNATVAPVTYRMAILYNYVQNKYVY